MIVHYCTICTCNSRVHVHVHVCCTSKVSLEVYSLDKRKCVYAVRGFTLSIALYLVIGNH